MQMQVVPEHIWHILLLELPFRQWKIHTCQYGKSALPDLTPISQDPHGTRNCLLYLGHLGTPKNAPNAPPLAAQGPPGRSPSSLLAQGPITIENAIFVRRGTPEHANLAKMWNCSNQHKPFHKNMKTEISAPAIYNKNAYFIKFGKRNFFCR